MTRDLGDALAIVTWTTRGAHIALSGVAISAEAGSCSRLAVCFGGDWQASDPFVFSFEKRNKRFVAWRRECSVVGRVRFFFSGLR